MALLPACLGTATAQTTDTGARMERVAEGVYAIVHDDATDEWPHGNTGVVMADDGVLVVDSTYLPSRARADIALIRSITDRPVRYPINTHWHFDHNNGNAAYREAFPGVTIVSERNTRDYIDLNNTWWPRMATAPDSAKRLSLAKLEEKLETGVDDAGDPLSVDAGQVRERHIRQRHDELEELASLEVVAPDLIFDSALTLSLGDRRIELRDWGRANSPHDVTVYLPDEQILFTGDIVVQAPVPYLGDSWPVSWIEVLRQMEAIPVTALVPGHGPVMHDHAYTRQVRELLEAATSRVEAMARRGMTLEQIQGAIEFDDLRQGVWSDPALDDDWKTIMDVLVERVWRGVRGQG
ncbi:MAG: MBL fold metallo-hydrolase [Gammaproteobacteria bacterium]|nr:MBL fold metallo-hydrolase [Gammaproteobacteria bacterium]